MSVTLLQLRTRARQRADMVNDNFVTDSELTDEINASIADLHDLLVEEYSENYKSQTCIYTLTQTSDSKFGPSNGQDILVVPISTAIPAGDFYKLIGIDAQFGSSWITLNSFAMNERNRSAFASMFGFFSYLRYRIDGSNIIFQPVPTSANVPVRIWYVPLPAILSADGDTLDDLDNYSEFIIIDCAIKMKIKREEDVAAFMVMRDKAVHRIEVAAQNRDAGRAEGIVDNDQLDYPLWFIF